MYKPTKHTFKWTCWARIRTASLLPKLSAIYFWGGKEVGPQDIKDSGQSEQVFDIIVRKDDSNHNEEKMALLAVWFPKFLRNKKPFLGILKKAN